MTKPKKPYLVFWDSHPSIFYLLKRAFNPETDFFEAFESRRVEPSYSFDKVFGVIKYPIMTIDYGDNCSVITPAKMNTLIKKQDDVAKYSDEYHKYILDKKNSMSRCYIPLTINYDSYDSKSFEVNNFFAISLNEDASKMVDNENGLSNMLDFEIQESRFETDSPEASRIINKLAEKKVASSFLTLPVKHSNPDELREGAYHNPELLKAYKSVIEHFTKREISLEGLFYGYTYFEDDAHVPFSFEKELSGISKAISRVDSSQRFEAGFF